MKKSLIIILAALLCVCIFADCGERGEENGTDVITDGASGEIGGEVSGEPQSAATDEAERGETTERGVETDEPSTQEKSMPNVINCTEEDARVMLETLGVVVNVEYEYNDDVADGNVIRASVEFGDVLSDGDVVVLYVNHGKHIEEEIMKNSLEQFTILLYDADDFSLVSSDILKYCDTEIKTYYLSDLVYPELYYYYYLFEHENVRYEIFSDHDLYWVNYILSYLFGSGDFSSAGPHWLPKEILGSEISSVDIFVSNNFIFEFSCNDVENNEKKPIVCYTTLLENEGFDAVSKDVDGDGIDEFIAPDCYSDGGSRLVLFRMNNGVIERGRMEYDEVELFEPYLKENYEGDDYLDPSPLAFFETYDAEKNVFCVTYREYDVVAAVEFSGLDCFVFEPYTP